MKSQAIVHNLNVNITGFIQLHLNPETMPKDQFFDLLNELDRMLESNRNYLDAMAFNADTYYSELETETERNPF